MFPSFGCCPGDNSDPQSRRRSYQERKLRMLTFWRDGAERQLAAVTAAINTLEQQMNRDATSGQN
ncbi:sigma factor SigF [Synechococcus sp. CS-1325]|uniref:sigma factor SigF n=1 Tax=unclassified Synechococcus TaxID=2626047 RepID=UPI000DB47FB8|nr:MULTISPECIES: sigma factor SigF [unclassified Synechococcus]MCT0199356.1 sigma factor SigF [Synechococcus sp. CS-1325]MCT0214413.1 sigma factor SigF [Synechococcus sp. CS-1326]MCT0233284.1 sigma factor SigF [Synechococcus sp. CS-1327]PZV02976.1 MAG: sigma factor SigF [Cyanobium sp.]